MRILFGVLVCASLGCSAGDDDGGTGGGETTGVGNEEFPDQAAARICGHLFDCGCSDPGYADQATCLIEVGDATRFDHEKAQNVGLTYDPQCGMAVLDAYDIRGCAVTLPTPAPTCADPCRRYVGAKNVGEECNEVYLDWHDCSQGLLCEVDGAGVRVCQDPCGAALTEGVMCLDMAFMPLGTCAPGLYCDQTSMVCAPWPQPDGPCGDDMTCVAGAFCDGTGMNPVCTLQRMEDEPCSYPDWCAEGLYCEPSTDVCTKLPAAGQDCALGGTCDPFSVCEAGVCAVGEAIACVGADALAG